MQTLASIRGRCEGEFDVLLFMALDVTRRSAIAPCVILGWFWVFASFLPDRFSDVSAVGPENDIGFCGLVSCWARASTVAMKIIIQLSRDEEAKALPILLRHSPGMILPERTYVLGEDAVGLLRNAGIRFTQLGAGSRRKAPVLCEYGAQGRR